MKKINIFLVLILIIYLILIYKNIKIYYKFINIKNQFKNLKIRYKNSNKKIINENNLKNFYKIIYFGYTKCSDICPIILNKIIGKLKIIKNFYKIILIFISIDNKKDNCKDTQIYIDKFKLKNSMGIIPTKKFIEKLSKNLKIIYKKYNISNIKHSNLIYIINKYNNIIELNTK